MKMKTIVHVQLVLHIFILALSSVTVACVAVMDGITRFLSLHAHAVILSVYNLQSHNVQSFIPN